MSRRPGSTRRPGSPSGGRRSRSLALALLLPLAAWPAGATPGPTAAATPASGGVGKANVVLVLIDTLRPDRTGVGGYARPTTPFLDSLARSGVVFEQAYAPAPWTLPSVVSLMSSQPVCAHGVVVDGQRLPRAFRTLAQRLARHGYATASFYANPYAGPLSGLGRGFDLARHASPIRLDWIRSWLDEHSARPFFLYVHQTEPHNPYAAKPRFLDLFGGLSPPELLAIRDRYFTFRRLTRVDFAAGRPPGTTDNSPEQLRAMRHLARLAPSIAKAYDAAIREADDRVRRLFALLEERSLLGRTLFIVVSDHGEEFGEHGGWLHDQSVYEELVRVLLLMRLPGGRYGGRRIRTPHSLIDVAPTILALAAPGASAEGFAGASLLPEIRGRAPGPADPSVLSMRVNRKKFYKPFRLRRGDRNLVVRDGRWKAIWNLDLGRTELYDLERDPGEREDLAAREPARTARLEQAARAFLASCSSPPGRQEARPARAPLPPAVRQRLRELGYVD